MTRYWKIKTYGDPLGKFINFLKDVWQLAGLEAMLVPLPAPNSGSIQPQVITDPARLDEVNPFKPLMTVNAAKLVPDLLEIHRSAKLGVLLRPCEMRALVAIAKSRLLNLEDVLTINVDCLGTFPPDDYLWRAERKGTPDRLASEALHFARQGGIVTYRYRSACQLCVEPGAQHARLNISVLGVPVRENILVHTADERPQWIQFLSQLADGEADDQLVHQHQHMVARMSERRSSTRERVLAGIADVLPTNIESLVEQFNECAPCQACMEVCPLCAVDYPQQDERGHYLTADILRWLVSCAGCGMCEQSCPQHRPLSAIFSHVRQQMVNDLA